MTPAEFKATYGACATQCCDQLGLDPSVMLAQWGLETAWGAALFGNNLANIRCSLTSFCFYATLDDFAAAYVAVMHQPNMAVILASVGQPVGAQMAALGASPWDSGHYRTGNNPPGSSLIPYQEALQMATIDDVYAQVNIIHAGLFGTDPAVIPGPSMQTKIDATWKITEADLPAILAKLDQILASLPTGGSGGLTPAQDALLTQIGADVAAIRARTDKDLAP